VATAAVEQPVAVVLRRLETEATRARQDQPMVELEGALETVATVVTAVTQMPLQ
jgi:hypothetical protein